MSVIVNVDQLALLRSKAVILHVSAGESAEQYGIPGAYRVNLPADFHEPNGELMHTAATDLAARFEVFGISTDTPVIVYDTVGGMLAARLWWLAKTAGLSNAAILNGGLPAWQATGRNLGELRDVTRNPPAHRGSIEVDTEWERIADADDVTDALQAHNTFVIDVRAPEMYEGLQSAGPQYEAGHIPGAYNIPAGQLMADHTFRDRDAIRDILEQVAGPAGAIVFSCHAGIAACIGAAAANLAGYGDVQVYDGSWDEWGRVTQDREAFPVETGPRDSRGRA